MIELHAVEWFTIASRGPVAVIGELPESLGRYNTLDFLNQLVKIDGVVRRVLGVEWDLVDPCRVPFGLWVSRPL